MASNSIGTIFKVTTWGESHGPAIGALIDGCPAGLALTKGEIDGALAKRAPGKTPWTSPRKEPDEVEILSGVFEGVTTGAPISLLIKNKDADSSKYEPVKECLRPGHANFTYQEKYGKEAFDYRGGGRASARETACRVAAGAVAKKLLLLSGIDVIAYTKQIGSIIVPYQETEAIFAKRLSIQEDPVFCPDPLLSKQMMALITKIKEEGDSIGGAVEFIIFPILPGLGDPVYEKLDANLAKAMMSIPASKGFEIGEGFLAAQMMGSEHNDLFYMENEKVKTKTNHAGGLLGGISNGMPVIGRVAFKPASSIMKSQKTLTASGKETDFELPQGSRHDPCVAIRAVPVVEAMAAITVADAFLNHLTHSKIR